MTNIVIIGGTGLIGLQGCRTAGRARPQGNRRITEVGRRHRHRRGARRGTVRRAGRRRRIQLPSFEGRAALDFFTTSTGNLLAAEKAAGAGHHVALSVVGAERLPENGYFRAKLAQEKLIKESGIPYSI